MSWRQMPWQPVWARVLVCLTIASTAVACTNAGPGPVPGAFQLTGYRTVSPRGAIGAVTVSITAADGEDILSLAQRLPKGPGPECMEDSLVYRVTVEHVRGLVRGTVVTGYQCAEAVSVTVPGSIASWHTDVGCGLYDAIRPLVPSRAEGTRQPTVVC